MNLTLPRSLYSVDFCFEVCSLPKAKKETYPKMNTGPSPLHALFNIYLFGAMQA